MKNNAPAEDNKTDEDVAMAMAVATIVDAAENNNKINKTKMKAIVLPPRCQMTPLAWCILMDTIHGDNAISTPTTGNNNKTVAEVTNRIVDAICNKASEAEISNSNNRIVITSAIETNKMLQKNNQCNKK